jgi:hypothetical protein
MRAFAFALSLLVLASLPAAAAEERYGQGRGPEMGLVLHRSLEFALVGAGAFLGFYAAEYLGIRGVIGSVVGSLGGLWYNLEHRHSIEDPQIKQPTAAREATANHGEAPTLVIRHISRVY